MFVTKLLIKKELQQIFKSYFYNTKKNKARSKANIILCFKDFSGNDPVLLLDDVFGELDIKKKNKLLKLIVNEDIQSIITTTDIKNINKKYLTDACIYEVNSGKVERK